MMTLIDSKNVTNQRIIKISQIIHKNILNKISKTIKLHHLTLFRVRTCRIVLIKVIMCAMLCFVNSCAARALLSLKAVCRKARVKFLHVEHRHPSSALVGEKEEGNVMCKYVHLSGWVWEGRDERGWLNKFSAVLCSVL